MIFAIMVSTFLLTMLIIKLLSDWVTRRQRKVSQRLKFTLKGDFQYANMISKAHRGKRDKNRHRLMELASVLGSMLSVRYREKVQVNLIKAGIPLRAEEMVSINFLSMLAAFSTGLLFFRSTLVAVTFGILGFLLPIIFVKNLRYKRAKKIESQLLDAIVLMANSLRAGYSFMQSIELLSREAPAPLSEEFLKIIRETRLGNSLEDSLLGLSKRIDSKEMELLVTGVLIQREVGGNLAEVLDKIAETIEKRIKIKGKIKTLTAQGRISAWIIGLIPFGLAAIIFGMYPEFGKIMFEEPLGKVMLILAAVMMSLGIVFIRRVVDIDV